MDIWRHFRRKKKVEKFPYEAFSEVANLPYLPKHSTRTVENLKRYEQLYVGDGTIFSAINGIAQAVLSNGFYLVSDNEQAKQYISDFLESIDFEFMVSNIIRDTLIYGDVFLEKIWSKFGHHLVSLTEIDPKSIEIEVDDYLNIKGYIQHNKIKDIVLKPEDVVHIRFYSIPSSPYGISLLGTNYDTVLRKLKVDEALATAVLRHGSPKFVITVSSGEPGVLPDPKLLEDFKSVFSNIDEKNEFIIPDLVKIENIDTRGLENVTQYSEYFISLLTSGIGVPADALGLGINSTAASGIVRSLYFEKSIKYLQHRVERVFNKIIFNDVLVDSFPDDKVNLRFEDYSPHDEVDKIKYLRPFIKQVNTDQEVLTIDEIREELGYSKKKD